MSETGFLQARRLIKSKLASLRQYGSKHQTDTGQQYEPLEKRRMEDISTIPPETTKADFQAQTPIKILTTSDSQTPIKMVITSEGSEFVDQNDLPEEGDDVVPDEEIVEKDAFETYSDQYDKLPRKYIEEIL